MAFIIISLFYTLPFKGFMDFPCGVHNYQYAAMENTCPKITVSLTTYEVGWAGGGCHFEYTENETLKVEIPFKTLFFQRINNALFVNGNHMIGGTMIRHVSYLDFNPWISYSLELEYEKRIECTNETSSTMIVSGNYGSEISVLKGSILIFISTLCIIFINKKIKKIS